MTSSTAVTAAECEEKGPPSPRPSGSSQISRRPDDTVLPGVAWIEAGAEHISTANRVCILFGVLLIAWASGLDNMLRSAYHNKAMNELDAQANLATVSVVKSVISAATQPTAAKISDVFGRIEVLLAAVFFYVLGSAIEASASGSATFVVGSLIHQIGWVISVFILEVIIADTTSLRSRLFFSYVPVAPSLCNIWISGELLMQMLRVGSWRFGFWVWCILCPVSTLPLVASLWWVQRKAKKAGTLEQYKTPTQVHGAWEIAKALFWQLDVVGILLAICVFGFLLVPLTANNSVFPAWGEAKTIVPLVIGVLCIPLWVKWESIAPHPMVPFYLLKDRAIWGALLIAFWMMFAWACQGDFMWTVLMVVFNQSPKAAIRIASLYSFCSTLTGIFIGMVVYRVRRLKPFVLVGTFLFLIAFGLMIHYHSGRIHGFIAAQILLGIAGGFIPYAALVSIQAAASHEHVAVITGLYLSMYNVGFAFGNAVSGIVYSQVVGQQLQARLSMQNAKEWYAGPLLLLTDHPPGTPIRDAVIEAFKFFQRAVCIAGACACLGLIVFSFCIRNPKLPDTQSLPYNELPRSELYDSSSGGVASPPIIAYV
ncbi:major facilitator superfamily transporter [Stagonosporopsis vannaccii]|nr:major facilitator superfamily transporter [Stagonosporopsis vannaccii]